MSLPQLFPQHELLPQLYQRRHRFRAVGLVPGSFANQNTGETYGIETELRASFLKSNRQPASLTNL